jgi:putative membrane protein
MSRKRFDKAAGDAIAEAVREIEKHTDAEVVVVVRGRSGSYRHADYLFGAIIAFLGLLFLLFAPFDFHTYWVPFDVIGLFLIGAFICTRTPALRRLLTSSKFRANAVRTGAAAMFYEAGIANTSSENGLLIYLSLLERRLEIIADRGILKAIPALKWNTTTFDLKRISHRGDPDEFIASLRELGSVLAEHMPATGENPNELVDGPRIELK